VSCEQCGKPPDLGQTLWPGEKWRCITCLEAHLPGKDAISKSMHQMLAYSSEMREAFDLETKGFKAEEPRNQAAWARMMAGEIRKQGMVRAANVAQAHGEVVLPQTAETVLHDTLTTPDLAAVEASLERSRLLLLSGTDTAALALDAVSTIQARNSLERMLMHQLATLHKQAMEQMGLLLHEPDADTQAKRLNAAARCMAVYQQGFLALHKMRQNGQQRILVQYLNVSHGGQAIVGNIERDSSGNVEPYPAMLTR
jgi:hypothetical protein